MPKLDENGWEVPDPMPVEIPAGFKRPETLAEQVQRLVRTNISREAAERGQETFEDSEDFDVDDEIDPSTPYETFFDPVLGKELSPQEFRDHERIYRKRYIAAQQAYFDAQDRAELVRRRPAGGASPARPSGSGGAAPEVASERPPEAET